MADKTNDIWNDNDGEEEAPAKRGRLRRFLLFALVLLAVLGWWSSPPGGTGPALTPSAASSLTAGRTRLRERSSTSTTNPTATASPPWGMPWWSSLTQSSRSWGADGQEVWSVSVRMEAPALESGGGRAVAYDVGGTELYVVDAEGEVGSLTAPEDYPFLSARLNGEGWLAVTAGLEGHKGGVTVYDDRMEEVFLYKASKRFVLDACVTEDCSALAAVTLGQENSTFVSNVVLYELDQEEPYADYDVTDGLVTALGEQDGSILTVSDTCFTAASRSERWRPSTLTTAPICGNSTSTGTASPLCCSTATDPAASAGW